MENFDLNSLGIKELDSANLIEVNGGNINPWWSVASTMIQAGVIIMEAYANAYIKFSAETGGKYVIHHAQ